MEKIALFVRNGLIGHITLNRLVPAMKSAGFRPVVFNTGEPYNRRGSIPELADMGFYETGLLKNVTLPFLDAATTLSLPDGAPRSDINYSFRQLSRFHGVEYHDVPNMNAPDFIEFLRDDEKLAGSISIRILQIFKPEVIAVMESKGFMWNLHTGILPPYKGVHAPYRAAANNEAEYGWTLHRVDPGIDTGPLLGFTHAPLNAAKPVLNTYLEHTHPGADLILGALEEYRRKGPPLGREQTPAEKASGYYTYPTSGEMRAFAAHGLRFIFSPLAVRDLYLDKFSLPGTSHHAALNETLAGAIGKWERTKESPGLSPPALGAEKI